MHRSVDDFQAPLAAVAGDTFMNLGQLVRHEVLRDRGDIFFYDAASDVAEARRRGEVFVFISHQCLGEDGPDPRGVHFAAMREAVESVARFARVKPERLRVWVDFASVPQANPLTQRLAITSVPTCVEINQCVGCDTSSLSHFSATTRPRWLRRAVGNRHRHAIKQASRRWRGG